MSLPLRQLASCWTISCWEGKWADDICDAWNINASSWNKVREAGGCGPLHCLAWDLMLLGALLDCRVIAPSDIEQHSIKRLEKTE